MLLPFGIIFSWFISPPPFKNNLISFWLHWGLQCFADFSPVAPSGGYSLVVLLVLLIVVAPLVEHRLGLEASVAAAHGLRSCSSQALEFRLSSCYAWV